MFGSLRARVAFDPVTRQQHAFGLLKATDFARAAGLERVTALEFGVASGAGVLNLCDVGRRVTRVTGVKFEIVGFDTGTGHAGAAGLPRSPRVLLAGDFPMDRGALSGSCLPTPG